MKMPSIAPDSPDRKPQFVHPSASTASLPDNLEFAQFQSIGRGQIDHSARIKNTLTIELDAFDADRNRQVKDPAFPEQGRHIRQPALEALGIDRSIAPQTKVLQCVQTGQRVAVARQPFHRLHEIGPSEFHARNLLANGSDIEHLDFTETGHMGDEPVHTGADVHVPVGSGLEDRPGDQQVLPEVFVLGRPPFFIPVMQAGQQLEAPAVASAEAKVIAHKSRQSLQGTKRL